MLKRSFDVVAAVGGLLLLWPVIVVCMLLARMDTGMSGIYSQRRIGLNGREFNTLKIRTMRAIPGREHDTVTVDADPRITRSGAFMRKFKLDELPQLWNVLIGNMSFVGPRPDVPGYADQLYGTDRDILQLKPGITGPATLKYRDEEKLLAQQDDPVAYNDQIIYPDKVRVNLDYQHNWTLRKDIYYILATLKLVSLPAELRLEPDSANDRK